jgi:hypothetical protein
MITTGAARRLWVPAVLVAVSPTGVLAQGCAMCRTALGGPDDPLAAGLNTSILFLMAMPFVLTASVGVWLAYVFRAGRRRRPVNVSLLPLRPEEDRS